MATGKRNNRKGGKSGVQATLDEGVSDYRHDDKRKNNPPAGLVARRKLRVVDRDLLVRVLGDGGPSLDD